MVEISEADLKRYIKTTGQFEGTELHLFLEVRGRRQRHSPP